MNSTLKKNMIVISVIGFLSSFIGFYASNTYFGLFTAFVTVVTLGITYYDSKGVSQRE